MHNADWVWPWRQLEAACALSTLTHPNDVQSRGAGGFGKHVRATGTTAVASAAAVTCAPSLMSSSNTISAMRSAEHVSYASMVHRPRGVRFTVKCAAAFGKPAPRKQTQGAAERLVLEVSERWASPWPCGVATLYYSPRKSTTTRVDQAGVPPTLSRATPRNSHRVRVVRSAAAVAAAAFAAGADSASVPSSPAIAAAASSASPTSL